jgi:hypothetical protein
MGYLFHAVPQEMRGEELIPLRELGTVFPDIYAREVKKYDDHPQRRLLPKQRIKKLNCPQAEVLHFSPLHPHLMYLALRSIFPAFDRPQRFFRVPVERIGRHPAIWFDMNRTGRYAFGEDEPEEMFDWLTVESYRMLTEVPSEALAFYREWRERGETSAPAMARIPHVMVRGRVSVLGCEIVDWREPLKADEK